jgi:hypothetical protein
MSDNRVIAGRASSMYYFPPKLPKGPRNVIFSKAIRGRQASPRRGDIARAQRFRWEPKHMPAQLPVW